MAYTKWLEDIKTEIIQPRAKDLVAHPFIKSMQDKTASHEDAQRYFSGLMWHLLDFDKHVRHLIKKRPQEVTTFLAGRHEDVDGDTDILGRIVEFFGGPRKQIENSPWTYTPHKVWVHHDNLLRSAIYSTDFPWQVGTAALTIGIESLVPLMIEPLYESAVKVYGVSSHQAEWLESRSGEIEKQHGENGYLILSEFADPNDEALTALARFYVDQLSYSMTYGLLESGMPQKV
ncbi:hypothetical protein GW916_05270 [bacterium]|nr:hypothetical protein [bacterium]